MSDDSYQNQLYNRISNLEGELRNAEREITHLYQEMRSLNNNLDVAGQRIGDAVHDSGLAIMKLMKNGLENIHDGIRANSYFAGKVELAKQLADLRSTSSVLALQKDALTNELDRIRGKKESIENKYDEQEKEIIKSYLRDIRRLGQHIYDILENDYGRAVEARFNVADFDTYESVCEKVNNGRKMAIKEKWQTPSDSLTNFISKRRNFRESLNKNMLQNTSNAKNPSNIRVKFCRVKILKTQKPSEVFVKPCKLVFSNGRHVSFRLEEDSKISEFTRIAERNRGKLFISDQPRKLNVLQVKKICNEFEKMKSRDEISEEFAHFASMILTETPPAIS